MRTEHYFDSQGKGKIHYVKWAPQAQPKAIVQIIHGIAEHAGRYEDLAAYLNSQDILVVAEDHMGHGLSMKTGTQGYFDGGWFTAAADCHKLTELTMEEYPDVPYILYGHSMGSFLARTLLTEYPDSGIAGAIICGTGWMSGAVLKAGLAACGLLCKKDEKEPSQLLNKLVFGGYNKRVEHQRTSSDWLSRDDGSVDAYIADPLCGFIASAGLMRDMLTGITHIQKPENLAKMQKQLPVFFIAGGDDPVGDYGKGVRQAAQEFEKAGMEKVAIRIYPLCRHEIHNEINRQEVYEDVSQWIESVI